MFYAFMMLFSRRFIRLCRAPFFCFVLCIGASSYALADNKPAAPHTDFVQVTQTIQQKGDVLIAAYNGKNGISLMNGISALYFDHYEGQGMELAVMALSPTVNTQTEALFTTLIGDVAKNAPTTDIQHTWSLLKIKLSDDAALLTANKANSFSEVFFQSFIILLREGFEAMLVITALLTYLQRSAHSDKKQVVYLGTGLALLASAITAYALNTLLKNGGFNQEALEGITMLVASSVLFYVSYWLFSKREAERWQDYLKTKMETALSKGSLWALGFAAFLAVYREGAETILFYQALLGNAQHFHLALMLGIGSAVLVLLVLYSLMKTASLRIPYRLFFTGTAFFLFYMAFYFIGGGLLELQEAGWVAITPINGLPPLAWLGIYPTWESTGAQLAFLAPSIGLLFWYKNRQSLLAKSLSL